MGTAKRERQKAGRQDRIQQAEAQARRQNFQRRIMTFGILAAVAALLIAVFVWRSSDDEQASTDTTVTTTATDNTTATTAPPTTDAPTAVTVAPGTPCVPLADELPPGTPPFEIPVGEPSAELVVEDLVVGDGAEAQPNDNVTINYIGVSCSTGKIFDSSYARGAPAEFPLAGLIAGWQEGIPGMKVGGQRLLVIPPDLGYGEFGSPPNIAGNETLIFLVELEDLPGS
jgi:peptidylprolyl isomerase